MTSGALKYESIEPADLKVRVYGTTAVITASAAITSVSKGQTQNNKLRYTDVWVLRDGAPVAVAVTPGISDGRMTEVSSTELQPGMPVITDQRSGNAK